MSTQKICQIPGNADVAGVGVRASVYIQSCLAALNFTYTAYIRVSNRSNSPDGVQRVKRASVAPAAASTTATEAPDAHSSDIDQMSPGANENLPPRNMYSTGEIEPERSEQYRAFLDANRDYLDMLKALERGILMVGSAVIISAFLESRTTGLTPYHALILLNISQINNWSGYILLSMGKGYGPSQRGSWIREFFPLTREAWVSSIPWFLHSAMMSGFGLYFWSNMRPFLKYAIEAEECQPLTFLWVFGPTNVSNHTLRISSLVFYSISAIPTIGLQILASIFLFANSTLGSVLGIAVILLVLSLLVAILILFLLFHLLINPILTFIFRPLFRIPFIRKVGASVVGRISHIRLPLYDHLRASVNTFFANLTQWHFFTFLIWMHAYGPLIYTIVSIELTIRVNGPNLEPEAEARWTYGQTLAMFTAVVSLALHVHEIVKLLIKRRRKSTKKPREDSNVTPTGDLESLTLKLRPTFVERHAQTEFEF